MMGNSDMVRIWSGSSFNDRRSLKSLFYYSIDDSTPSKYLNILDIVQKRAALASTKAYKITYSLRLHQELGWDRLQRGRNILKM